MIDYNEDRKDLQIDKLHQDLVAELEEQAAPLGVTVDYYISEFTNLSVKQ
jgi:t-SNARE complex subunit (syntaxin)